MCDVTRANVINTVGIRGIRSPAKYNLTSGYSSLNWRLTLDFVCSLSAGNHNRNTIKRVCVEKGHVPWEDESVVNSYVLVLEDDSMARLLLNRYCLRHILGEQLFRQKEPTCNDGKAQKNTY